MVMENNKNSTLEDYNPLLEGNIIKELLVLALPIMATYFLQMAYNLADMMWIGRVGSSAVAAVGTAGFYMYLSMAFIALTKIGLEVGIAQSIGRKEFNKARCFARNGLQVNTIIAFAYALFIFLFKEQLIGFFKIDDPVVVNMALDYITIISIGFIFSFTNPVLTGIFNGTGQSKLPFRINSIGVIANVVLDPIFILGLGPVPSLGVKGAALATIMSQAIVTLVFIVYIQKGNSNYKNINLFKKLKLDIIKETFKVGYPVALQSGMFTVFSILIARIIANWGPIPIAVQKVGSQIESISWMTASGYASALATFVGQNYGADNLCRIRESYTKSIKIMTAFGICTSLLLIVFSKQLFALFIPEPDVILAGGTYLVILGFSQLFMCLEITTAGVFNGLGMSKYPSIVSIFFTGLRVPMALVFSSIAIFGVNGVWISISLSSMLKGIVLVVLYFIMVRKKIFVEVDL